MDPITAIVNGDFEAAESLRGTFDAQQLSRIIAHYWATSDWEQKAIAVHMLQDCYSHSIDEVMRDALNSPTVETRATALCSIKRDSAMFDRFVKGGSVEASMVDAAIQAELRT